MLWGLVRYVFEWQDKTILNAMFRMRLTFIGSSLYDTKNISSSSLSLRFLRFLWYRNFCCFCWCCCCVFDSPLASLPRALLSFLTRGSHFSFWWFLGQPPSVKQSRSLGFEPPESVVPFTDFSVCLDAQMLLSAVFRRVKSSSLLARNSLLF